MLRRVATVLRGWAAAATPRKALGPVQCGLAAPDADQDRLAAFLACKSPLLQVARDYARPVRRKKPEITSHLDDIPPTMLMKSYARVPIIDKVDDVVKRLLSLEMANQKEKLKIKKEQLAAKVRKSPNDSGSLEVQIAYLTAKIRTIQEHLQVHHKDKVNRRLMLMVMDRRKLLLKALRNKRYDDFENTCTQLNIQYTCPPLYNRKPTRRYLVKKAFCRRVFEEAKKQKALGRLKQKQRSARTSKRRPPSKKGTPV